MALDPKLRDVLDFLPCEPCLERPSAHQEVLCSICHRLNRTVALRCQVSLVAPGGAPSEAEIEAAREEARLKQAEFEALQHRQEADEDALERIRAERDELLARQRDLEDRLARLEAQSHGGQITFVDEHVEEPVDEVVEFSRVDLGPDRLAPSEEEVMEFESLGTIGPGFGTPDANAWDDDGSWEEAAAWPGEEAPAAETDWGETPAAPTYGDTEEAPWEEVHAPAAWDEADDGRAHADTRMMGALDDDDLADLDEQTRADLSELEAQLEELEAELRKRRVRDPNEE